MRNITNAIGVSAVALMAAGRGGSAALQPVPTEPEVEVEVEQTAPAPAPTEQAETEAKGDETETAAADDAAPKFDFRVYADEPDDLPEIRTKAKAIEWGFKDMPVRGAMLIPAKLADRARGAIQNARQTKGKDNGKLFVTRQAKGLTRVKDGVEVPIYPNAVKGDIEVYRRK
jgi:hypothetical protein